jgi:hypothetical protein
VEIAATSSLLPPHLDSTASVPTSFKIEFVSPPIAIGEEPIQEFSKIETDLGVVKLLKVSEGVKDRLASFFHWNDRQGLE